MRLAPLGFAALAMALFGLAGSAQAQVNLLHPAHHVYTPPKTSDRPVGNTTSEAPAPTPQPPTPSTPQATATSAGAPASPPKP